MALMLPTGHTVPSEMIDGEETGMHGAWVPGFKFYMDLDKIPGRVSYFRIVNGNRLYYVRGNGYMTYSARSPESASQIKQSPGMAIEQPNGYVYGAGYEATPVDLVPNHPHVKQGYPVPDHYLTTEEEKRLNKKASGPFWFVQDVVKDLAKKASGATVFLPLRIWQPAMIHALKKRGINADKSMGTPKIAGLFYTHVIAGKNSLEDYYLEMYHLQNDELLTAAAQLGGAAAGATVGIPPGVSSAIIKKIIDFLKGGFKKGKKLPITPEEAKLLGKNVFDKTMSDLVEQGANTPIDTGTPTPNEGAGTKGGSAGPAGKFFRKKDGKYYNHRFLWWYWNLE